MREMDYKYYKEKIESMDTVLEKLIYLEESEDEEELNRRIPFLLEAAGEYTLSDRVYIFDWYPVTEAKYHNTFEWCRDGIESQLAVLQAVPVESMSHWHERFERGKSIVLKSVEKIRHSMPSEYELLKMQDIRSEIAVPIFFRRRLCGFIGLDNPEVSFLELSARMMGNIGVHLSHLRENQRILGRMKIKECS